MIRTMIRFARPMGVALLAVLAVAGVQASAQNEAPAAQEQAPQAPAPSTAPVFPKPDPANFTASAPSKAVLEAFLQSSWGKEANRVWQIQAILKTQVPDLARVVVLIGDKTGKEQPQIMEFLAFADGKHFIAGDALVTSEPEAKQPAATTPAQPLPTEAFSPVFSKPDPTHFTAATPTIETINAFTHAMKGFDENILWQVEAVQKTPIEGMSRVVIVFADKSSQDKPTPTVFFALPDGKHIVAGGSILPFGAQPFAEARALMQQKANGPFRGSADKDLMLVEFADFQCPHCKAAQANMEKLAVDYPNARIVFMSDPIASIHPQAVRAASFGACVAKLAGNTAFFNFASSVFEGQDGLGTPDGATLTINSSLAKAGVDQAKATACADAAETKAAVDASIAAAAALQINQVPTLVVNGRVLLATVPYDLLKKVIDFQMKLDNVK